MISQPYLIVNQTGGRVSWLQHPPVSDGADFIFDIIGGSFILGEGAEKLNPFIDLIGEAWSEYSKNEILTLLP